MSVAAKKGLGTGLDVLFGESIKEEKPPEGVSKLPIAKVEPRDNQPRSVFDEEALAELAESIREYGVIQPVTVRQLPSGYYQLIAGERRWRAARLAGLTEIPAQIIEADDRLTTELALVENLQREDLNPVEEAQGYRTLMEESPELLQYVPLKHIASYLWITPQSLSRIRAKLGKKKG